MSAHLFHLAFPVQDIASTRAFYEGILNCVVGRQSERWIDFNFFGHQISAHLSDHTETPPMCNQVDDEAVPSRHFGVILDCSEWNQLVVRLQEHEQPFYIAPYTRFEGKAGEQRTFFIQDPSQNFLEFKCFSNPGIIFQAEQK